MIPPHRFEYTIKNKKRHGFHRLHGLFVTHIGKPPPMAARLEKALLFRRAIVIMFFNKIPAGILLNEHES
jgi:hypothetical protein